MADSLIDVLKKIKKSYGDSVVKVGVEALELDGCADDSIVDLGNAVNNYCKKNNLHNE